MTSDAHPGKNFSAPTSLFPTKIDFDIRRRCCSRGKQLITGFAVGLSDGLIILALHVAGRLAQRYFEMFGFYAVSIAGGMLSSASAVAAAGTAAAHNEVPVQIAADGAVLAWLTSTLIDIPLVARVASQRSLTTRLSFALCVIGAGWDPRHCLSRSVEVLMGFRFGVDLMRARRRLAYNFFRLV